MAESNQPEAALLRGRGYAPVRSYWRMTRDVAGDAGSPPQPPDGYELRPPELPREGELLHALDDDAFAGNADYSPHTFAEFRDEHLAPHDLAVSLSLVAERTGGLNWSPAPTTPSASRAPTPSPAPTTPSRAPTPSPVPTTRAPAGFLLTRRWEGESTGYVDLLAVHPDHRRRGLASALLRTAFATCAAAGLKEVQLSVARDNPRAVALYERVGMHVLFRYDSYERAIAG